MSQSDFVSRGQALVAAGQFQEAVKVCRLGLLGRPTTVEGRVVLGQALLALKRFDEVLAEMRVALDLDHSSVPAQVLKAEALLRKGDTAPALEVLHKARQAAPGDPRILQLIAEAENGAPRATVSHPSVGFVGNGDTKHYPGHSAATADVEDSGPGGYTRPTSPAPRRSSQRPAAKPMPIDDTDDIEDTEDAAERPEALRAAKPPPPAILAVGDRSGTVEVDPLLDGVEVDDDDLDDVAAPPAAKAGQKAPDRGGARGSVKTSSKVGSSGKSGISKSDRVGGTVVGKKSAVTPTMELDLDPDDEDEDDDLLETRSPESRAPGPRSSVRNLVAMPSGVIGGDAMGQAPPRSKGKTVPPPRSNPGTPFVPSIANAQTSMSSTLPPTMPPAAPLPPAPRAPIAAALPTMAAAQPPPPFVANSPFSSPPPSPAANLPTYSAPSPPVSPAANLPTMALQPLSPAQQASAAAVDQLFGNDGPAPVWAARTIAVQPGADPRSVAAANEPTMRPSELDPSILALMAGGIPDPNMQSSGAMPIDQVSLGTPARGAMKTGMRKRSRFAVVLWVVVGVLVIGGGVFAGFQIRAMRLQKQIAAARQRATDLAKADTWSGWTAARDSLSNIVGAKPTLQNRAALARARAIIAYEFGDGIAEAKAAVDDLAGQGGLDGSLAAAFLALAMDDAKAAKTAADAAVAAAPNDPAAQYAVAELALLAGDAKTALAQMKAASDKDARPLYGVGLARAQAAAYNWDDAIATLDRVLAANSDHPAAVIARGDILASSGRVAADPKLANEVRAQVDRIGVEGRRPIGEQQHGVSPTQVAFAYLSLAKVDTARGDLNAARRALKLATDVNLDDQRFAEDAVDVLVGLGDLTTARSQIDLLLKQWAQSRRARIALAEIYVAQGHASDAVDLLAKATDVIAMPDGLAMRGVAQLAAGDAANAALDFDAALKKLPTHEPAIVGRAWLEIQTGELDAATKRVAERYSAKGSSTALTVAYAATLRRAADLATRDKAKGILEKVVKGLGVDVAVAQLELARIYRDSGDFSSARAAYNEAAKPGSVDARIELALLSIEDQKPLVGRDMLDTLLKEAGEHPSPQLVIEGARARMLAGDHTGAEKLLELADKMSSVERWKLDRERARLAFRRSQFPIAAVALGRALDTCGGDAETFLLAVDTAVAEPSLADKVKKLAPERLKGKPELAIVNGKLLLAQEKAAEAYASFRGAKEALKAEKASLRRVAQADFGLALIAANRNNAAEARVLLELVMQEDPSIVDTYIFAADLLQGQPREVKKAFEYAQKATELNPDYAYAWLVVGKLATKLGDKRTLTDAIGRLQTIAPQGDELKELQALRDR